MIALYGRYVVHELQPLYRVTRLFRSMGLRTLPVVDSRYCVVGLITRANITHMHVHTEDLSVHGTPASVEAQRRMVSPYPHTTEAPVSPHPWRGVPSEWPCARSSCSSCV